MSVHYLGDMIDKKGKSTSSVIYIAAQFRV